MGGKLKGLPLECLACVPGMSHRGVTAADILDELESGGCIVRNSLRAQADPCRAIRHAMNRGRLWLADALGESVDTVCPEAPQYKETGCGAPSMSWRLSERGRELVAAALLAAEMEAGDGR